MNTSCRGRARTPPASRRTWSEPPQFAKVHKTRRLNAIRRLAEEPPPNAAVLYVDEVDVHLNPKIGNDWMLEGQQKQVLTPGQNAKHYLAGALDAVTGRLQWVEGPKKTSALFIARRQH